MKRRIDVFWSSAGKDKTMPREKMRFFVGGLGLAAMLIMVLGVGLSCLGTMGCGEQAKETQAGPIRFVTWKPNQPAPWNEFYKMFDAEHPGLKLALEVGPHSSTAYHDMLTQKLKNKSTDVDIFLMDVIWPPEFASAGWAEPLDQYFSDKERQKFLPGCILANTFDGHIYGVPLYIASGALYYRKDLLQKYGFAPPKTWDELTAQAQKIMQGEKKEGKDVWGYSGQFKQYEGLVCDMLEFVLSFGGHILDPKSGKCVLAEEQAVAAVKFVRDNIVDRIAPKGVLTYQEPESLALFVQGGAAFLRNWPYAWSVSNDPEKSRVAGKVGIAKLPHLKGQRSYATLGGWQVGISKFSQNKEEAWKFVQFLTSEKMQKHFCLKAGLAPTRAALYEDAEVLAAKPHFKQFKEVFATAYPRPRSPVYPAISQRLQTYFSAAISDPKADIKALAMAATADVEKLMALAQGK